MGPPAPQTGPKTMNIKDRVAFLSGMLLSSQQLYLWSLDQDFHVLYTNCPDGGFYDGLLQTGNAISVIRRHFLDERRPILCADKIGIGWIAQKHENFYYLLGPFLTMDVNEQHFRAICRNAGISPQMTATFLSHLESIPVLHISIAHRYCAMLYYCLFETGLPEEEAAVHYDAQDIPVEESWTDRDWHGSWRMEKKMTEAIRAGDFEAYQKAVRGMGSTRVGNMVNGDPLRQSKKIGIVYLTIISRCAIVAGVSPEGSYRLSDHFIQRIEACRFVTEVNRLLEEVNDTYFSRIRLVKSSSGMSRAVRYASEYIENHVQEKINLEDIAKGAGYSGYYLSRKFQQETGKSLTAYIQERKIEYAKRKLIESAASIADLSEELSLSSPSYFAAVFRKVTGQSPAEYTAGGKK